MRHLSIIRLSAIFALISILFSCTNMSKEKNLIKDYEQNFDGTITDLSLKIHDIERTRTIFASDSLTIASKYLETKRASKIAELKIAISGDKEDIRISAKKLTDRKKLYEWEINYFENKIASKEESIKNWQDAIANYEGDCKNTFLEETYNNVQKYKANPSSILAYEYKVTYSIKNPFLNNVKQTITKNYIINPSLTKILDVSE